MQLWNLIAAKIRAQIMAGRRIIHLGTALNRPQTTQNQNSRLGESNSANTKGDYCHHTMQGTSVSLGLRIRWLALA
jgi:hypothetical protein